MSDLLVSSYQASLGDGSVRPTETVGLNFRTIAYSYFTLDGTRPVTIPGVARNDDDDVGGSLPPANNQDEDGSGLSAGQLADLGATGTVGGPQFSARLTPAADDPQGMDVSWKAVPGTRYFVEWTPDLNQPFVPLNSDGVVADSPTATFRIQKSGPTGFFRVHSTSP